MNGTRVGVAKEGYDIFKKPGRDEISWALHSNGKTYYNNEAKIYCPPIKSNNQVTLVLDRDLG